MKFSASSSELLKKLTVASGVIGSHNVLPILEDFLFEVSNDTLTITASNLDTSIIDSLEVSVEEEGNIAIPARILINTLKALPEQPITFEVNTEGNRMITITSSYGKYKLSGDNAEDYPELPEKDNIQSLDVSCSILNKALAKTLFATSTDELRQAMQGVFIKIEESSLIFVATDAHKLVKYSFETVGSSEFASFIVPQKGLTLLKNALPSSGNLKMSFNNNNVYFNFDSTEIIIRLVNANYPDYNAVIPVDNTNIVHVDRQEFLSSLRRISIYSNKSTNQVILNLSEGSLTISAQDLDFSNEATEQMPCEYNGDAMNIGFNGKFLIEMLNVMGGERVLMKLANYKRAGLILPSEQDEGEELLMLLMPVMLGN